MHVSKGYTSLAQGCFWQRWCWCDLDRQQDKAHEKFRPVLFQIHMLHICFIWPSMLQCVHLTRVSFSPGVLSVAFAEFSLNWKFGCDQNLFFVLSVFNRNCKLSNSNFSMACVDILYIDITRRRNGMGIDHKESGNGVLYLKTMEAGVFLAILVAQAHLKHSGPLLRMSSSAITTPCCNCFVHTGPRSISQPSLQ